MVFLHLFSMKSSVIPALQAPAELLRLFRQYTGTAPETVVALPQSGSARRYYRMQAGNFRLIGTVNAFVKENHAFRHFSEVFRQHGLPVPEVLAMSKPALYYLQEDLGDLSLHGLIQQQGGMQFAGPEAMTHFRQALMHLVVFQLEAHKSINYTKFAFTGTRFNRAAILDDLQYFRFFFIRLHPELRVDENRLLRDMEHFSRLCAAAPSDFFMYRDFQSRNIMIRNHSNHYIDFQGGRRGALQYDLVSLLWQATAGFTQPQREEMIVEYQKALAALNPMVASTFGEHLPHFVHLRQMQVLGAYGLRGLVQRKVHFLKSIPLAIRAVGDNLRYYPLPSGMPELAAALQSLSQLTDKYPLDTENGKKELTVSLYSFSYLQGGIPADTSGHGGGFVFDCRALPNPGREEQFRNLTGRDKEVIDYLMKIAEVQDFLNAVVLLLRQSIDEYTRRGFRYLSVGFGCTGGQHRSVYCAEQTTAALKKLYPGTRFILKHTNIGI